MDIGAKKNIIKNWFMILQDIISNDIEKLENKRNLMGIIDETHQAEGLQIYIGSENNLFGLTDCTTIISPFRNKDKEIIGAIGVIGPMRLNYAKIIPVVDYTANMIGKKFQIT